MPDNTSRPAITMSTPSALIELTLRVVAVTSAMITAEFDMPSSVHDQALSEGWFHLGPLSSGVGARPFGPGPEVRVEARLDPRLIPGLIQVVDTPAGASELIVALDSTARLRSEASWYACAATTEVPLDEDHADLQAALDDGSLREGYRSAWGSGDDGRGLPIAAYLAELLAERFHDVDPLVERSGFRWKLSGSETSWTSTAIVDDEAGWCVLYSLVDGVGEGVDRAVLVERASDLNLGLLFGSWHIADEPPSVRFRSSLELPDRVAAGALLDRLVSRHLDIVDEYASTFSS